MDNRILVFLCDCMRRVRKLRARACIDLLCLHSSSLPRDSQAVFWGNDVDANGASPVFYEGELEGFSFIRWAVKMAKVF